ncbi:MAG: membrane protein [Lysobacterales bacterium]|jgi:tetratricopeptide (TPR) repeat protein|nr:MAG: membrane protein [Xanthomonadales bacterium]
MRRLIILALGLMLVACAGTRPSEPDRKLSASAPAAASDEDDPLFNAVAAEFALEQGDVAGAASYLVRAAELQADPALAERATQIAFLAGDPSLIRRALARWSVLAPDAIGPRHAQAVLALRAGDLPAAREAIERLLADPNAQGWVAAVQALAHGGEPALTLLAQLSSANRLPEDPTACVVFSQLAERLGDLGLALELAARARASHPQEAQTWLWEAELRRRRGDFEGAVGLLEEGIRSLSGDGGESLSLALAGMLAERGKFAEAERVLLAAGESLQVIRMRAAVAARAADPVQTGRLYEELRARPDLERTDEGRLLLGQLAELLRRSEEALQWYRSVSRESESWAEARRRSALLLATQGRVAEALKAMEEVETEEEALDRALFESEILQRAGRHDDALAVLERAATEFADEPRLLYSKGLLLERLDRVDEAIAVFRRLVELDPEDPSALNALGYTLADRTDRLDEAYQLIERALAARPDEPAFIDSMGWVLFRKGRAIEALPYLERAFALQPDAEVAAHLGEVLWVLGQQERAREVWQRGDAIDPEHRVLRATIRRFLGE